MLKQVLLFVCIMSVSACGGLPRTALDVAELDGWKLEIAVLEQDVSMSTSSATISFNGNTVHSSTLQDWKMEITSPTRQLVSTQFTYEGRQITVKRQFDAGVSGVMTTYLFYADNNLLSSVPIAF